MLVLLALAAIGAAAYWVASMGHTESAATPQVVVTTSMAALPVPTQPDIKGWNMSVREQEIQRLAAAVAAEKDATKQAALKANLAKLATAELTARKAAEASAASKPQPMYPVGMEAKFSDKAARIKEAHQDGQGNWHYTIDLDTGVFLYPHVNNHQISEAELLKELSSRLGQPLAPGQAYLQGMLLMRNGKGGQVERVTKNADGTFSYQLRGWPNAVLQSELLSILRNA